MTTKAQAKQATAAERKSGGLASAMTLRDHFAGLAMRGIFSSSPSSYYYEDGGGNLGEDLRRIAPVAYQIADAMIAARAA